MKRIAAVVGMTTVMVLSLAGQASARVIERGPIHDEFSERISNFCDVTDLTVRQDVTVNGRYVIRSRGRDRLAYFQNHVRVRTVYTNGGTGEYVTETVTSLEKDLRVTDNGDGTLTILVLATGNATVYDESGKAIARNPGQIRYEVLIDHGGTPAEPADDTFIEFLGVVKESTGRTDDFCAAVVPALQN
jgi:hypothetical protein